MASRPLEIDGPTCSIHYIARATGAHTYGKKRLVDYVAELVEQHGLPAPFPIHVKGQGVTREVREDSRFNLEKVDHWLDDWGLPPGAAAVLDRRRAAEAGAVMDERARALGLQLLEGGRS